LAHCLGIQLINTFEGLGTESLLMIGEEEASELAMLEEVLTEVLVLRLSQHLRSG